MRLSNGSNFPCKRRPYRRSQQFVDRLEGQHEVVESEPGVYRRAEITAADFAAFELTSLLPGKSFDLHIAKMALSTAAMAKPAQVW
ncbi:MAG: hypothetical protein JO041_08415 [Acidobacteria bacterium]|nr:hypothetical protein [Acidobacteriota bacterium]